MSIALLAQLLTAAGTSARLTAFLEGAEIESCFTAIGDVHYEAALDALRSARSSSERSADLREARVHLRAAHFAYLEVYDRHFPRRWLLSTLTLGAATENAEQLAIRKDLWTCLLLAATYAYFGERGEMQVFIKRALNAHNAHEHETPAIGQLLNLVAYREILAYDKVMPSSGDIRHFEGRLMRVIENH